MLLPNFYERYVDGIYGYCFRLLGTREAAEDATSQVFSRALTAISRFQPKSTVRSWLFTIAHNITTDRFRSGGKVQEQTIEDHWDIADDRSTVDEVIISEETRDMVRQLLTHLSTDQRRVIELRLADLTGPEIQIVLGKTRSWVNTTQFRAIQRLRSVLDATGGDPHV